MILIIKSLLLGLNLILIQNWETLREKKFITVRVLKVEGNELVVRDYYPIRKIYKIKPKIIYNWTLLKEGYISMKEVKKIIINCPIDSIILMNYDYDRADIFYHHKTLKVRGAND